MAAAAAAAAAARSQTQSQSQPQMQIPIRTAPTTKPLDIPETLDEQHATNSMPAMTSSTTSPSTTTSPISPTSSHDPPPPQLTKARTWSIPRKAVSLSRASTVETNESSETAVSSTFGDPLSPTMTASSPTTTFSGDTSFTPISPKTEDGFVSPERVNSDLTDPDLIYASEETPLTAEEAQEIEDANLGVDDPEPDATNATSPTSTPSSPTPTAKSKLSHLMNEAVHFAGGLLHHPYESNKQYAILRHSSGLVYYQGPSTSIAITIFSRSPLPENWSLWLQSKGWSGTRGMRLKSVLGQKGEWIDVTPCHHAAASEVNQRHNRAWERDIAHFQRTAVAKERKLKHHIVRQTCVLRIPGVAEDGYFRAVLCAGPNAEKVLCGSPSFRLASLRPDASSVKGAGWKTLPLEIGLKVGYHVANSAAHSALAPAANALQSRFGLPTGAESAAAVGYKVTGAQNKVDNLAHEAAHKSPTQGELETGVLDNSDDYVQPGGLTRTETKKLARQGTNLSTASTATNVSSTSTASNLSSGSMTQSSDDIFPVHITGRIAQLISEKDAHFHRPTMELDHVASHHLYNLSGMFAAWISVSPSTNDNSKDGNDTKHESKDEHVDWQPSIISIAPSPAATRTVASTKVVTLYPLHPPDAPSVSRKSKARVLVIGKLRSWSPHAPLAFSLEHFDRDVARTGEALRNADFAPEKALEAIQERKKGIGKVKSVKEEGLKRVDTFGLQLQKSGVRFPGGGGGWERDVGRGGLVILR